MNKMKNSVKSLSEDIRASEFHSREPVQRTSANGKTALRIKDGDYTGKVLNVSFGSWEEVYTDHPKTITLAELTEYLYEEGYKNTIEKGRQDLGAFYEDLEGKSLKAMRLKRGFSQTELANAADVQQYQISRYETGQEYPNAKTMTKLCAALQIDPNTLFSLLHLESD